MRHAGLDVDEIARLIFDHLFQPFSEFVAHFAFDDVQDHLEADMDVRVGDATRRNRGDIGGQARRAHVLARTCLACNGYHSNRVARRRRESLESHRDIPPRRFDVLTTVFIQAQIQHLHGAVEQRFFGRPRIDPLPKIRRAHLQLSASGAAGYQFLTSNRRTADQGPEPPPLFARTRHHILSVGSVLVLN